MKYFARDSDQNNVSRIFTIVGFSVLVTLQAASAGELPATAVKMSSAEVKALYSGKTADWNRSQAYFAPNGTTKNVSKQGKWVGNGTWSVRFNGEKPSKKDDYTGEAKKLKTGDRTKRRYNRLVKKLES